MIALATDALLVQIASGESVPCSAEVISVELASATVESFDPEFVRQAASAVFHYFKHELGRQTVSVGEFAGALEKVLCGFADAAPSAGPARSQPGLLEFDLARLARESGQGGELLFFPRLRTELRQQLRQTPRVLRFHGLRGCVKQLAGARRWSLRCRTLQEQIVAFLRECLSAENGPAELALVVQ